MLILSHSGLRTRSISRIENHERTVTDYELRALAEVLEVDVVDLYEK